MSKKKGAVGMDQIPLRGWVRTENWPSALARCRSKATLVQALSVWTDETEMWLE